MAQITVYLDDEVAALLKDAVKGTSVSQSQWVADAIKARVKREWPESVKALAGAWPDFPWAEEIRARGAKDAKREKL